MIHGGWQTSNDPRDRALCTAGYLLTLIIQAANHPKYCMFPGAIPFSQAMACCSSYLSRVSRIWPAPSGINNTTTILYSTFPSFISQEPQATLSSRSWSSKKEVRCLFGDKRSHKVRTLFMPSRSCNQDYSILNSQLKLAVAQWSAADFDRIGVHKGPGQ